MRLVNNVRDGEHDLANGLERQDFRVQPAGLIVPDFVLTIPAWW